MALALALPWVGTALVGPLFSKGLWVGAGLTLLVYAFVMRRWIQPFALLKERIHRLAAGQGEKRARIPLGASGE